MNPEEITAQLRDIRPAVDIPVPAESMSGLTIALIVVAVVALAAGVAWWLKRRQPKADAKRSALEELRACRELLASADSETYAISVSDILRRYIESKFGSAAVRQTSEEFLADLAANEGGSIRAHRPALQNFLRHCDLVKFACGTLDASQREQLHESARQFIEATSKPLEPTAFEPSATGTPAAA